MVALKVPSPVVAPSSPHARAALHLVKAEEPSDEALLSAVRAGDDTVADAFCARIWPTVVMTVRRLLGSADNELEDVAQISVMEALSSVKRYRGESGLDPWVRTVTAHTVYKHLRRRGFERRLFTHLDAAAAETSRGPGPVAVTREREAISRVLNHVAKLDEEKATAWVLHDVYGHDMREIATITGVSEAAAQTRVSRGRRELHERLGHDPSLSGLLAELEGEP
jgi:RNA polymerase sigma-70 factor (ECF subfamily)